MLGLIVAAALAVAVGLTIAHRHRREPMELWRLVNGACVPDQQQHDNPAPCALVDLHQGVAAGYVVLKDIRGTTQYLVIPTARVTGIEDPKLLRPGMPNYFADAWRERAFSERAVP
ncbi:MAG TPA: CDP-diacylglycerol diphosphatase, partial [Stellaceae bacterium]|nr:CDP-diacylglycerol diphosphatase [Stellaceae bacterium]